MNEDGQCYPDKPCPPGFARVDNDESGACLPTPPGGDDCNPSYPDSCIKSPPPKLNCPDISFRNFKVIGSDPHGFDGDKDGVGCENGEVAVLAVGVTTITMTELPLLQTNVKDKLIALEER